MPSMPLILLRGHCTIALAEDGLCQAGLVGTEESPADGEDPEAEVDKETIHRLCPTYATDINSPLRHVRTRIYFTSESHVHSLLNVLRFSHLAGQCTYSPLHRGRSCMGPSKTAVLKNSGS